jgi:hypothetical protein
VADLASHERAFHRAGLPSFIAERTAREDIWTRAVPIMALVFGAEVLGAIDLELAVWANVLLILAAVTILLITIAAINRFRGRPALARPEEIGKTELAVFVFMPALIPLILNQQVTSAIVTAAGNALLLVLLYGAIGYGLVSIVLWAGRRLIGQLATSLSLLVRALSLLMLFSFVLFLTVEMWEVFAEASTVRLVGIAALFVLVGTGFLVSRLPREIAALEADVGEEHAGPPLDRRERVNVGLVFFVSQSLQVLTVTVAVGVFFVAFGLLALDMGRITSWVAREPDVVADIGGVLVTAELLRVAGALAAVSGLYYAIAVLTDQTYREEFLTELTSEMRDSFVQRADYRRQLTPESVPSAES